MKSKVDDSSYAVLLIPKKKNKNTDSNTNKHTPAP